MEAQEWKRICSVRSHYYRWFAELFAQELSSEVLQRWLEGEDWQNIHQGLSILGLTKEADAVGNALTELATLQPQDRALELAADFAQCFLLDAQETALPYASYYLSAQKTLYGESAQKMRAFLANHTLTLNSEFREPDDHISVYLSFLSLYIQTDNSTQELSQVASQQLQFLRETLLTWIDDFVTQCSKVHIHSTFYPALCVLLRQFLTQDAELLKELCVEKYN